jgi:hypothetical protein
MTFIYPESGRATELFEHGTTLYNEAAERLAALGLMSTVQHFHDSASIDWRLGFVTPEGVTSPNLAVTSTLFMPPALFTAQADPPELIFSKFDEDYNPLELNRSEADTIISGFKRLTIRDLQEVGERSAASHRQSYEKMEQAFRQLSQARRRDLFDGTQYVFNIGSGYAAVLYALDEKSAVIRRPDSDFSGPFRSLTIEIRKIDASISYLSAARCIATWKPGQSALDIQNDADYSFGAHYYEDRLGPTFRLSDSRRVQKFQPREEDRFLDIVATLAAEPKWTAIYSNRAAGHEIVDTWDNTTNERKMNYWRRLRIIPIDLTALGFEGS